MVQRQKLPQVWQSIHVLFVCMLCSQLLRPAQAQQSPGDGGSGGGGTGPMNLDLSSTDRSLTMSGDGVTIDLGGTARHVSTGDKLTTAELFAVNQVLAGGQTVVLGALGNAVGGTVSITAGLNNSSLQNLVIPTGVTAIHDFGTAGTLSLAGNFVNSGNFFGVSTSSSVLSGVISATNIFNQSGALLSTALPSGGLTGITPVVSSLNLSLFALQNIVNAGTISSSGALSATAGGSIINALPAVGSPNALMQALGNINMQASSIANYGSITSSIGALNIAASNLTNSGLLQSVMSNINIGNLPGSTADLVINNLGGTIQALDSINLRTAALAEIGDLTVTDGNLLGETLNAYGRKMEIHVDDLTAKINLTGSEAHVSASTENLVLGNINLSGDPSFFNRLGNVVIGGDLTYSGQALAVVAKGNITTAAGAGALDTSSNSGNGGDITIIAGVDFTSSGPNNANNDTTSLLTLTAASATGGKIDLRTGTAVTDIDSSSYGGNGKGGKITMVAFKGGGAGSGTITLPTSLTVLSHGNNSGANGDITMIAGATAGTAIDMGAVDTNGGLDGTGHVSIRAATPTISSGTATILNGALTGTFTATTVQSANLVFAGDLSAGGSITVTTGKDISHNGRIGSEGGAVTIVTGGSYTNNYTNTFIDTDGGGNVSLITGAQFTQTDTSITITGNSATGGSIRFPGKLDYFYTAGDSKGGDIRLIAFAGSSPTSGEIDMPGNGTYNLDAYSNYGSGGGVTILAGATSGATLHTGGVWAQGPVAGTKEVLIRTATPVVGAGVTLLAADGSISSGAFTPGTLRNSPIVLEGSLVGTGGPISVATLSNITLGESFTDHGTIGNWDYDNGGAVSLVAGGNITNLGQNNIYIFTGGGGSTNGGSVLLAAGASFSQSGSQLTITGASATGGSIDFNRVESIETWSDDASGGNVTFLAFDGGGAGSGRISMPPRNSGYNIATGGETASGNITVLAGAAGTSLQLGGTYTEGEIGSTGGAVSISTNTPSVGGGVTFDLSTGGITSGSITAGTARNSDIVLSGDLVGNGSPITVLSLGNISFGVPFTGYGDVGGHNHEKGTTVTLVAGGNLSNLGHNGIRVNGANDFGDGGNILLAAGAAFNKAGNTVTITGASATGGSVLFSGVEDVSTDTWSGSSYQGDGGNFTVLAFAGGTAGSGQVSMPPSNSGYDVWTSGGNRSGDVTIMAGNTSGLALSMGGFWTEGGEYSTGGAVTITPSTPTVGGGVSFNLNTGKVTAGSISPGALQNGDMILRGDLVGNGSQISLVTPGSVTMGAAFTGYGDIGGYNFERGTGVLIVAGGNIAHDGQNGIRINSANDYGNGGHIGLIAGAAFNKVGNSLTITGASASGGSVLFAGINDGVSTDTDGVAGATAGNVNVVAFNGASAGSGAINMVTSGFDFYTGGTVASGNVTILAGATDGSTLLTGGVWTEGTQTSTGGSILISPSTPQVGGGVTFNLSNGAITGGAFSAGALQNSSIELRGSVVGNGSGFNLISKGNIDIGVAFTGYGTLGIWDWQKGGNVLIVAGGNITNHGQNGIYIATAGDTGPGGNFTMVAGAAFNQVGNTLNITGASASGGTIVFNKIEGFYTDGNATNGPAGNVTIAAYAGGGAGTGDVVLNCNWISTEGTGTGANGDVTIIGGVANSTIVIPEIYAWGDSLTGGNVVLRATQPNSPVSIDIPTARVTAGSFENVAPGTSTLYVSYVEASGSVRASNIVTTPTTSGDGGSVEIYSGSTITVNSITTDANTDGEGGFVVLDGNMVQAAGSLSTRSAGKHVGGEVEVYAATTISLQDIDSAGQGAGAITIDAVGNVSANNVFASGGVAGGAGGAININSDNGSITVTGSIEAKGMGTAPPPNDYSAGSVTITAGTSVAVQSVSTAGGSSGGGGKISITAGGVSPALLSTGNLNSVSDVNGSGNIDLTSSGSIQVNGTIITDCLNQTIGKLRTIQAGKVTIDAGTGLQVTGVISAVSLSGAGGAVTIDNAANAISLMTVTTRADGKPIGGIGSGFLQPVAGTITINQAAASPVTVNGSLNANGTNFAFGSDVRINLSGGNFTSTGGINTSAVTNSGGDVLITNSGAATIQINTAGNAAQTAITTTAAGGSYFSGVVQIVATGNTVNVTGGITTSGSGGATSAEVLVQCDILNITGTINTSNAGGAANSVLLTSTGSMTTADINTSSGAGNGGLISLNSTNDFSTGNITSTGFGTGNLGGTLLGSTISKGTIGNVDLHGSGGANGGTMRMLTGRTAAVGPLTFGNVDTSGASGGVVSAVSLGSDGTFIGGTITTDATSSSGTAGSISMATLGTITLGAVSAQGLVNGSRGGSIFLTSRAAGTAITVPSINTSANNGSAGNLMMVVAAGSSVSVPSITQTGSTAGYTFSGSPAPVMNNITVTSTATFGAGGVTNYRAGGYGTAAASGATFTVDTSGDSRLIVPIVVRSGNVNLSKIVSKVTGTEASSFVVYAQGSITLNNGVDASSPGTPPSIGFQSSTGSVTLNGVNVSAATGGGSIIVTSPTSFTLSNGSSLIANGTGAGSTGGQIIISVPNGSIDLGSNGNTTGSVVSANGVSRGGLIRIEASDEININDMPLSATGSLAGGTIKISSFESDVDLFSGRSGGTNYNTSLDVSSSAGPGGTIEVFGRDGVYLVRDPALAKSTSNIWSANGATTGGTISFLSTRGEIDLSDAHRITATAPSSAGTKGGTINILAPLGEVTATELVVTAANGGAINNTSDSFFLDQGLNLDARGLNGAGGDISLYTGGVRAAGAGDIQLGTANNTTGQKVDSSGTTSGGTVYISAGGSFIDYSVPIYAKGQAGKGGDIGVGGGEVELHHAYWNESGSNYAYNADIDASSATGVGGSVGVGAGAAIVSLRDTSNGKSGYTNTSVIQALGITTGGSVSIVTTGGEIDLSETNLISASASAAGSVGGSVQIQADSSVYCCYSNTSSIEARGQATGGSISASSVNGDLTFITALDASAINVGGTDGTITLDASKGDITTAWLTTSKSGGSITATAGGDITNNQVMNSDTIVLQTVDIPDTTDDGGSIIFGADITGRTSVTVDAFADGNIVRTNGAVVYSPNIILSSDTGLIGDQTNATPASTDAKFIHIAGISGGNVNLTASTSSDVRINSAAPLVTLVGTSFAGTGDNVFQLLAAGDIAVSGTVDVGSSVTDHYDFGSGYTGDYTHGQGDLRLETYSNNGGITVSGSVHSFDTLTLATNGTGVVGVTAGGTVSSFAEVEVIAYNTDFKGAVVGQGANYDYKLNGATQSLYGYGVVRLIPNGSQAVAIGDNVGNLAPFDVTSAQLSLVRTDSLVVGNVYSMANPITTGDVTITGDVNISGAGPAGVYNLEIYTRGNYTGTGKTITLNNSNHIYVEAGGSLKTGSITGVGGPSINGLGYNYFANTDDISGNFTGSITVDGDIVVAGTIELDPAVTGTVQSGKSVISTSRSVAVYSGDLFTNDGIVSGNYVECYSNSLTNTGAITGATGLSIYGDDDGVLLNSGTLQSTTGNMALGYAVSTNTGVITVGKTLSSGGASFVNAGTITANVLDHDAYTIDGNGFTSTGTFTNNASGTVTIAGAADLTSLSAMTNNGVISAGGALSVSDDGLTSNFQVTGTGSLGASSISITNAIAGGDLTILQGTISGPWSASAANNLNVETTKGDLTVTSVSASQSIRLATPDANKLIVNQNLSSGVLTLETGNAEINGSLAATTGNLTIDSRTGGLTISSSAAKSIPLNSATNINITAASGVLSFASSLTSSGSGTNVQAKGGTIRVESGVTVSLAQSSLNADSLIINGTLQDSSSTFVDAASITNTGSWTGFGLLSLGSTGPITVTNSGTIQRTSSTIIVTPGDFHLTNTGTWDSAFTTVSASGNAVVDNFGGAATSGTLKGGTFSMNAPAGSVSVYQGTISGPVTLNAATSVAVEATVSTVNVGTLSGASVRVSVPDAQTLTLSAPSAITAGAIVLQAGSVQNNIALNATAGSVTIESRTNGLTLSGTGTLASTAGTTVKAAAGTLLLNSNVSNTGALALNAQGAAGAVTVAGGVNVSSTGNLTASTFTLNNGGSLSSTTGDVSVSSTAGLSIGGAGGSLSAASGKVTLTAAAGSVSAVQSAITGTLTGSATTSFSAQASSGLALGTISATTTIDLKSTAGGLTNAGAFTITGDTLNLTAAGNIGAAGAEIKTDVNTLTAGTTGANVYIIEASGVTLGTSSAGSLFNLAVGADFTTSGASTITAPNIAIAANGAGHDIIINSNFNAATSLTLTAADAITRTAGTLTTPLLTLNSTGGGNIGASGQEILTTAGTLALSTTGSAFVSESDSVNVAASSVGALTLGTGAGGSVTLTGDLVATGAVVLNTNAAGAVVSNAFTLSANSLTLSSTTGQVGTGGTPFRTNVANLTISTGGSAFIAESNAVNLNASNANDMTVATAAGGSIVVNGAVTAAGTLTLNSAGGISDPGGSILSASTLNMSAAGDIGSAGAQIRTTVTSLSANTTGANIYIVETDAVNLGVSSAGTLFDLSVGASVTTALAATITAPSIAITATGAGNDITIGSDFTATTGITLIAADAIIHTAGTLNAPLVTLQSTGGGNIGGSGQEIATNAATLTVLSTGSSFVNEADSVNLAASNVGNLTLTTGGGGTIVVAGNTTATGTVTFVAAGGITDPGAFTLTADTLSLSAAADIGAAGARLRTSVNTLGANTTGANVYITESTGVSLNASSAGSLFDISVGGNFSTGGAATITAPSIAVTTTGAGNDITINSNLNASTSIALTAADAIIRTAGTLTTPSLSLSSTGGGDIGASGQEVVTDTTTLTVSTSGSAFVNENNAVNLNASTVGSFTLTTGAGGSIAITGGTTATGTLTLSAAGGITDAGGFTLGADTLTLSAGGDIGASGARLLTSANTIGASTTGANVYITEATGVSLNASAAGTLFDISVGGNFTTGGAATITAPSIAITTTGAGNDITVNSNLNASASLSLTAADTIVRTAGKLTSAVVSLSSTGGGSIGASGQEIITDAGALSVSTTGSAFVNETDAVNLNASSVGNLTLVTGAGGAIAVTGNSTATGTMTLTAGGAVSDAGGFTLTANALNVSATGDIGASGARLLTNVNTLGVATTGANAYISEATGVTLNTSSAGTLLDITVGGNFATGAASTISAPTITIATASGGNISVDSDLTAVTSLTLSSGGTITRSAGTLTSALVTLASAPGLNIGAAGQAIVTSAGALAVSTGGSAFIDEQNAVNLNASSVGNLTLTTGGGGNIDITGNTSATGTVTLNSAGAVTDAGGFTVSGNSMVITAAGDIGAPGARLRTNVATLSFSGAPNVYITETSGLTLNASSAGTLIDLSVGLALAINGAITAPSVSIVNAGNNISLNAGVSATTSLSLNSTDLITRTAGTLRSASVVLTAGGNIGASGQEIVTDAGSLSLNTLGAVFISEQNALDLNASTVGNLTLTTGSGILAVTGNTTATGSMTLSSGGAVTDAGGFTLGAGTLNVTATGDIGAGGARLLTNATNASFNTTGANAFITESSGLTLNASSAGTLFDLTAAGTVAVSGAVTAPTIAVTATGAGNDVTLAADLTGVTAVTVTAADAITRTGGKLTSALVSLSSTSGGNLGAAGQEIVTDAGALAFNSAGSVFINELNSLNLNASSAGALTLTVAGGGSLSVTGNTTVTGTMTLSIAAGVTDAGGFTLNADVLNLTAGGDVGASGARLLTNANTMAVNTTGTNAYIGEATGVTLNASSAGTLFDISVGGNFTTGGAGAITAPNIAVTTTGAGNDITVNSNLNAASSLSLTSADAIVRTAGTLTSALVSLSSTGGGDIGASGQEIVTNAGALAVSSTGSIFVNEANAVNLNASNAGNLTLTTGAGGSIAVTGNTTVTGTLSVSAGGAVSDAGGFTLAADTLTLSAAGDVGAAGARLLTDANSIGANTTGSNVYITEVSGVTVNASSAGALFDISVGGNFTTGGASTITAPAVSITTTGAGNDITINSNLNASASLSLNSADAIVRTGGKLTSASVSLSSAGGGNIGASGQEIVTDAGSLTVSTTGSAFVNETDGLTLNASSIGNLTLRTGGAGSLSINGNITATGLLDLTAGGSVSQAGAFTLASTSMNLSAGTGVGAGGTPLLLQTGAVAASSAAGGVFLRNTGALSLGTSTATGSTLSVVSTGALTTTGVLSGTDVALLTTTAGSNVALGAAVNGTNSVDIRAAGAGTITQSAGQITSSSVVLRSGAGDIGSGGTPLSVVSSSIDVATSGSAFLANTGALNFTANTGAIDLTNNGSLSAGAITAVSTAILRANGNIATTAAVQGADVTLRSTAVNGSISTGAPVTGSVSVTLNAAGTGTISTNGAIGVLGGGLVTLTSGSGDIGSAASPVYTTGTGLIVSTTGSVFINQSGNAVAIGGANVGGSLSVASSTNVSVTGAATAGDLTVNASGGSSVTIGAATTATNQVAINTTGAGAVTVSGGNTLRSTAGNVSLNTSQVVNDGTISSQAANGKVNLTNAFGTLSVSGTGAISATGGGASSVTAQAAILNLGGSQTVSGAASLNLTASNALNVNGSVTVNNGAAVNASTPHLSMGAGSQINATGASEITVDSPAGSLQVTAPDSASSSILTAGGTINFTSNGNVLIDKSAGLGVGTLSLAGSSVTVSPSAGTLTVAASTTITNVGDQTYNVSSLVNSGTVSSTGNTIVQNATGVTVAGTGTVGGGRFTLNSANGAVTVNQGAITATVQGSSQNNFSVTAGGATLTAGSVSASAGSVHVTNTAGALNIADGATVDGATGVILTGGNALNVGTGVGGVTVTAGRISGAVNALSTNMNDFDMSAITTSGSILFTTTSGNVTVAPGANINSFGGSIGFRGPGDINLSGGNQLFAQGGNIWLNGLGNINMLAGGTFTAVGREIPAGAPVWLPNEQVYIAAFQGGSIALDVDSLQPNYDAYLRTNWESQRTSAGSSSSSGGGISTAGTSMLFPNGGTIALVTSNPNKVAGTFLNVLNSSLSSNGGVIYIDPPGSQVNVANVNFAAFGPQLIAVPPPPPPPPPGGGGGAGGGGGVGGAGGGGAGGGLATINIISLNTEVKEAQRTRIVPLDTIDQNVPLSTPQQREQQCVPVPLAQFKEVTDGSGGWAVASGYCESFTIEGQSGSAVVSAGGTQIGPGAGGNSLRMKHGKMLAMSGKEALTVVAGDARVNVAADSAMIVEESTKGVLRITQLAGAASSIEVERNGKKQVVQTQPGHEIIVSMGDLEAEELIPVDGIDRVPIGATMTVSDLQVRRNQIDRKQLLERDKLLSCTVNGCFPVRLRSKLNKMRASALNTERKPSPLSSNFNVSHPYKSVGFVQPAIPPASPLSTVSSSSGVIKHTDDARFSMVRPGAIVLRQGEMLLAPERNTTISSGLSRVEIGAGAIAIVSRDVDGCLRVRGLWETASGRIVTYAGSGTVHVRAGQEIVVGASDSHITEFLKHDNTARRRLMRFKTETGEGVLISEVSFLGTVTDSDVLPALLKSQNPDDKNIAGKVMKMAVVLSVVTSKHGNFQPHARAN